MRAVPLCELGQIVSGSTPRTNVAEYWGGDIPWVTPADLSEHEGVHFRRNTKHITKAGLESCSTVMLPAGSILFSSRAPIGHCAVTAFPVCTNQGFKSIVPSERLQPVYGYFALRFVTPSIVAKGRGATFIEVNKEMMDEVPIPYCSLPEQERIADLLEQADRLCRTRRFALELSDGFLPAAFLWLFGDPNANPKGWKRCLIDDVLEFSQYGTSQKSNSHGRGYPVLGMANITYAGEVDLSNFNHVELSEEEFNRLRLEPGDVLFNRTNSTELVGKIASWRVDMDAVLASYLVKLRLRDGVVPEFFSALLNSADFKILFRTRCKKAVGQSNISPTLLKGLPMYIPPFPLQKEFASLAQQHELLRAGQREALRQAEHLFQSLLHRAFALE